MTGTVKGKLGKKKTARSTRKRASEIEIREISLLKLEQRISNRMREKESNYHIERQDEILCSLRQNYISEAIVEENQRKESSNYIDFLFQVELIVKKESKRVREINIRFDNDNDEEEEE